MKYKLLLAVFVITVSSALAQVPTYVPTNGLVGWWPFNGNANDESGNGNNGIINNKSQGVILFSSDRLGFANSCIQFDNLPQWNSDGAYLSLPASLSCDLSQNFSFSFWAKPIASNSACELINKGRDNSGAFFSRFASGFFQAGFNSVSLDYFDNTIYNKWSCFTIIHNGSKIFQYRDGIVLDSMIYQTPINLSSQFWIGRHNELGGGNGSNYPYVGFLDELAIWNRALSPTEIQQLYTSQAPCTLTNNFFATDSISACGNNITLNAPNAGATYSWSTNATTQTINANTSGWYKCTVSQGSTCNVTDSIYVSLPNALPASLQTGLVGYWPFCGNANDESGNGNNGIIFEAIPTIDRFNNLANAYIFDGINDFIHVDTFDSSEVSGSFTLSYWMLYDNANYNTWPYRYPFFKGTPGLNTDFNSRLNPQNKSDFAIYNGVSGSFLTSVDNITSNEWVHVINIWNGSASTIYLNGILDTSSVSPILPKITNAPIYFGAAGSLGFFKGKLDDFCIWNRALSSSEIQQLYTSQSANITTNNTSSNNANPSNLPSGISYQAIARDSLGQPLANTNVEVRFTLRDSSVTGAVVYKETHALTTNQFGLFTTAIGIGNAQSGVYANINWMGPAKFLDVELKQGSNYIFLGSQQLLAVPYANAASVSGEIRNNQLPVYNDNAAAMSGGLLPGKMYRTPSGVLMIVY